MSDTPKFTVVDRRKFRGDEEAAESATPAAAPTVTPKSEARPESRPEAPAPRLTLVEPSRQETTQPAIAVAEQPATSEFRGPESQNQESTSPESTNLESTNPNEGYDETELPPAPTREESLFQKTAYDQAAERIEVLVRSQNPGAPPQEQIGFEHLVQQLYLSAMMQMGAGTPEGQRPRIDILGARQTIDLLQVLQEKAQGNLTPEQERTLNTVLFEVRLNFVDLTRMISAQPPMPPPPGHGHPGAKR